MINNKSWTFIYLQDCIVRGLSGTRLIENVTAKTRFSHQLDCYMKEKWAMLEELDAGMNGSLISV